jgi:hypothetical protein
MRDGWRDGDRCRIWGEGSEIFTLHDLRDDVAMPYHADGRPNGWKSYHQMERVADVADAPAELQPLADILARVHEVFENLQPGAAGRLGGACTLLLAGWKASMSVERAHELLAQRRRQRRADEMMGGEKLIWSASFTASITAGCNPTTAIRLATRAVQRLRDADVEKLTEAERAAVEQMRGGR